MKKLLVFAAVISLLISCNKKTDDQANTEDVAIISTEFGDIYVLLYDETPIHKENFLKLAKEGFYDSTTFHRVIESFMIQGGDPNSKDDIPFNDGQGGPGYTLEAEFNNQLVHKKGAIAAARLGDQANPERRSSGSQFYIVHGRPVPSMELDQIQAQRNELARQEMIRKYVQAPEHSDVLTKIQNFMAAGNEDSVMAIINRIDPIATQGFVPFTYTPEQRDIYAKVGGAPFLDGFYTVFGEVIRGLDVVDSIATQPTGESDRPLSKIPMTVTVKTFDKQEIETEFGYSYN